MPILPAKNDPGQVGTDTITCDRTIRCAWSDRFAVAEAFQYTGYEEESLLTGILECRDPIVIRGSGKQNQAEFGRSEYEQAILQIRYSSVSRYQRVEINSQAEFLTEDPKLFVWKKVEGGTTTYVPLLKGEAPGKILHQKTYKFDGYVRDTPSSTYSPDVLFDSSGKINAAALDLSDLLGNTTPIFAAETVLLKVETATYEINPLTGLLIWKIPVVLVYKPNWDGETARGWNWFWRASTKQYEQMYLEIDKTAHAPYQTANLSALLDPFVTGFAPEEEEEE